MEKIRLGDVCIDMHQGINTVADKIQYCENGYPIIQSKNITKGILDTDDVRYIDKEKYMFYKEKYQPNKNDILIANIGTIGKSIVIDEIKELLIAWNIFLIKVNQNKINSKYLNFYFNYLYRNNYYNKFLTGGTVKFINKKTMSNIEIPKINLKEQIEIVNKLDKVQNIIDLRKKQIGELDELIKAQFVEMFGKPFDNSKWKLKKLGEVVESIYDGTNIPLKYYQSEGKVLFLRIQNVWRNEFRLEDSVYVSEETNKRYIDTSLKKGDLLITKIGRYYTKESSLGRVAIYLGEDNKANYSNNIMKIRVKEEINSEFLNVLLNLDDYQKYIRRVSKGGTDKRALSKSVIEKFPIICPPVKLQKKFIEIVRQINKKKFMIEKSLKEIEEIEESLMNIYFGG